MMMINFQYLNTNPKVGCRKMLYKHNTIEKKQLDQGAMHDFGQYLLILNTAGLAYIGLQWTAWG